MTQTSDRPPESQESRTPCRREQNARIIYAIRMRAGLAMMATGAALFLPSAIHWLLALVGQIASLPWRLAH